MKAKILKIELYLLFILSLTSVFYYFFNQSLPDNYLDISSTSSNIYSFNYYISSFFAQIAYYVGPWIVIPFLIYAFVYNFILASRNKDIDVLIGINLLILFYFITYLVAPKFLGSGLLFLSDSYIDIYSAFFSTLLFGISIFYLTLRGTFFVLIKKTKIYLEKISTRLFFNMKRFSASSKKLHISFNNNISKEILKAKAAKVLREDLSISRRDVEKREDIITPIITSKSVSELSENLGDDSLEEMQEKEVRVTKSDDKFFKTSELIECISKNIKHQKVNTPDSEYFDTIIKAIEGKLGEFKLDGRIINILKGPVVDTFELELGSGVKVSKVTGLSDDIGLALNGAPIRVVYPMRGRSTIGIEVPRNPREFIYLDEVMQSDAFNDSNQRLPVAMGKDAFGDVKVVDLAAMPHMLVAGATGAGKSVFINTLLVSLITKKSPRQLKLILIDPKQLELALFQDLPHLMLPVVTDPKSSEIALLWAVQEMERRYTILKELGVKSLDGFNKKIKNCDPSLLLKINQYYEDQEDEGYELPYIVIVIDEFADLILSKSGKEIETNVNRLAAKARAAGIHLVVATQRPSTDVVTGVVKANFPTRVAFRVATGHDSKTILDQYGAQKLLGKGDMLYKHGIDLLRLHSSFVEENEIEGFIKMMSSIPSSFNTNAMDFLENGGEELDDLIGSSKGGSYTSGTSSDPIYQEALEVVYEQGTASASMLQRRLRVGYNRAANLVEEMERNGVVGPAQGSKPRKVMSKSE